MPSNDPAEILAVGTGDEREGMRDVFTGRFTEPPVEVLFDRICRLNGVEHLLTQPRTATTAAKIERFHRALRIEFDTRQVFTILRTAQQALDEWVAY